MTLKRLPRPGRRGGSSMRGECKTRQVPGAKIALASGGGAGALFNDVMLVGADTPA